MATSNDLFYYLMCSNLKAEATYNHLGWYTFAAKPFSLAEEINKLSYETLLRMFHDGYETGNTKADSVLLGHEKWFSKELQKRIILEEDSTSLISKAWIRTIDIYKDICELSKDFKYHLNDLSFKKRVFKKEPVTIESKIEMMFANPDGAFAVIIRPYYSRNSTTRITGNPDLFFVLDYLKSLYFEPQAIVQYSFKADSVERKFYKDFIYPSRELYSRAHQFFESIEDNGKRPNVLLCNTCPSRAVCTGEDLNKRIYL